MMRKSTEPSIFIVCGKSPLETHGGGYATFALGLAETLSTMGYRPTIVALGPHDSEHDFQWGRLVTCRAPFSTATTALPFLPFYAQILAKRIEDFRYSLSAIRYPLIVWGLGPWSYVGVLLKRELGSRVTLLASYFTTLNHEWISAERGVAIADYGLIIKLKYILVARVLVPLLSRYERAVITESDVILTNYKSTEDMLKREFHVPPKKFFRTRFALPSNAVLRSTQKPYRFPIRSFDSELRTAELSGMTIPPHFILTICRQDPRKGINVLLRAMKILKDRGHTIPLVVCGDGPLLTANKRLAHNLGLDGLVTFTGFVKDTQLYFQRATMFCLPSFEEGAGALVINEAMAYRLPIVASNVDGIPEDVSHYEKGRLVSPGDPMALARELRRMVQMTHG